MLNDVEAKEKYHVKISNRFADLENLNDGGGGGGGVEINKILEVLGRIQKFNQPQRI
jgi:hypothetical protein